MSKVDEKNKRASTVSTSDKAKLDALKARSGGSDSSLCLGNVTLGSPTIYRGTSVPLEDYSLTQFERGGSVFPHLPLRQC